MFFLRHPQPVRPRKAVAEQIVSSERSAPIDTSRIIVERSLIQMPVMVNPVVNTDVHKEK
ncbi:hypothetical protein H8K32_13035 [Undibacterium jejuense]|uniref:Uncharacterized protein n=1 Tax=Undibacterium jejuense TaxID=1344949 RepID=A0A923HLE9_9BURK|nr:hypothetical protein [Undibacterium jejuense]MBC3863029.1 hypothetical protein [Undibacterium jejuense]